MARDPFASLFNDSSPDVPSNGSYVPQAIGFSAPNPIPRRSPSLQSRSIDSRVTQIRHLEEQRNKILESLLIYAAVALGDILENVKPELVSVQLGLEVQALKQELQGYKAKRYTAVLIDGDDILFRGMADSEGGGNYALALLAAIQDVSHFTDIRIHIYANLERLASTLQVGRIRLDNIVSSFNSCNLKCDIIDTGVVGPSAKITARLKEELEAPTCGRIILGVTLDERYAMTLRRVPTPLRKRIQLVRFETNARPDSYVDLSGSFESVQLDTVLQPTTQFCRSRIEEDAARTMPVLVRVESNGTAVTPATPAVSTKSTPALPFARPVQSSTWAALAAQPPPVTPGTSTKAESPATGYRELSLPSAIKKAQPSGSQLKKKPGDVVNRNKHGQRIDDMDTTITYRDLTRIKNLKLCNIHYLQGSGLCDGTCGHSHTHTLSPADKNVLREIARTTPCYHRTDCNDPWCIYGHRCPQSKMGEDDCYYGSDCRFHGWGHGINTRVVKTTRV